MTEFLGICVLFLIACVAVLFWYTNKLHYLLEEVLKLINNNIDAIGKVQKFSYDTHSRMIDVFKQHLANQHHIYDESEDGYDGKY